MTSNPEDQTYRFFVESETDSNDPKVPTSEKLIALASLFACTTMVGPDVVVMVGHIANVKGQGRAIDGRDYPTAEGILSFHVELTIAEIQLKSIQELMLQVKREIRDIMTEHIGIDPKCLPPE